MATPTSIDSTAAASNIPRQRIDWRRSVPVLRGRQVTLREIRPEDAEPLVRYLADPQVRLYLAPPPATAAGFRRFARAAHAHRLRGSQLCLAVVPKGQTEAIGVVQVWPIEADFTTAEWGFVIGRAYWGTGVFEEAARLLLDFVFTQMGVRRLEARAASANERGNAALRKLGAVREGCLRGAFRGSAERMDAVMWSILADEYVSRRLLSAALTA